MTDNGKRIGKVLLWSGLGLVLLLGLVFWHFTSETLIQQMVQRSVLRIEKQANPGLFVYSGDSLVSWNHNDVNPRLMRRKASPDNDTIVHLLSGYYYVKSYQNEGLNYYQYNLLSTCFPTNNPFTENYNTVLPQLINADIAFHSDEQGVPIFNKEGKLLSNLTINSKPQIRKSLLWFLLLPILLIVVGALTLVLKRKEQKDNNGKELKLGFLVILLVSILSTYIYSKIVTKRENARIRDMAETLVQKRDTCFETSFVAFSELVQGDSDFIQMVLGESNVLADVVLDYSKELLFDDRMNDYTVTLTICDPGAEIAIQPGDYLTDCDAYFRDKLDNNKHLLVEDGLYFMDYYTLDPNYIGKIVVTSDTLLRKTLFYEFYKAMTPEGFSYDYSVANYRDGQLVYKYGRYVYPNFLNRMELNEGDFSYSKHYKHYSVSHGENDVLVISLPRKGWSETTAPFALFFLGLLLPFLLVVWLRNANEPRKWRDRSFGQRLQALIVLTLGISFLVVGPVSVIYMRSLYNQNTANAQFETTRTLVNEMRNDLDFESLLQYASRDRWDELLQRYANTFFTDINLYQLNGQLLATTRPEIFELNLQAPLMNAEAYQNIHHNHELYFTHQEQLGEAVYESAYLPLTDAEGNTLAYLNTPFFSSTTDLQKEIKNFVLTYLNIILLLLVIALIFVLRLTQRLTQPLALIQNKLGGLKIDQKNEPIEWRGNDEIGALIKQYNQLVVELEKSAAELRRTAAESAWRSVARQVAHEIHNSLTPMRLSVQMLQRSAEQQDGMVDGRIQRTTTTLLEQIDALSDIASSFSQYAKLPVNNPQPLDLAELVSNLVNLYDNADNIEFHLEIEPEVDYTFNGDKTNLNSAIGNIIKNATQAIGLSPNGRIDVSLRATETSFAISVKDNGKGIKEEDKKMIFVPNFTTKTGGSGVGLSLAYNIILSAGGSIGFESQEGVGTEFIIDLPRETSARSK